VDQLVQVRGRLDLGGLAAYDDEGQLRARDLTALQLSPPEAGAFPDQGTSQRLCDIPGIYVAVEFIEVARATSGQKVEKVTLELSITPPSSRCPVSLHSVLAAV
jgi:hypothetical protein